MNVGDYIFGAIGILFYIAIGVAMVMLSAKIVAVAESLIVGIAAGVAVKYFFHLHTVFCILIGFAAVVLFLMIMRNFIGFWVIVLSLALLWGSIWGFTIYESSDWIWGITTFLIMCGTTIWIHVKGYEDIVDEYGFNVSRYLPRKTNCSQNNSQYSYSENSESEQYTGSNDSNQNTYTYENTANEDDYYEILGLKKGASQDEIKAAYRKLSKKYHPDVNDAANASVVFRLINEAYNALVIK